MKAMRMSSSKQIDSLNKAHQGYDVQRIAVSILQPCTNGDFPSARCGNSQVGLIN